MRAALHALTAVLLLAGASSAWAAPKPPKINAKGEAKLAAFLEGRTAGAPVDCIDPRRADEVQIFDGAAIVYKIPGGKLYVNRPSAGAGALEYDVMLSSRTYEARLCKNDMMIVTEPGSHLPSGALSLGAFVPYGKAAR